MSAAGLQRHYRRLLFAYPRSYRRRHADEILTTLMEAAEPGQARPTGGDARDLIVGGLRQRFRLPVGRLMALAAVLSAIVGGGLGAAAGSAAGWSTVGGRPEGPVVRAIASTAIGDKQEYSWIPHTPHRPSPPANEVTVVEAFPGWTPDAARRHLEAAGWQIELLDTRRADIEIELADTSAPSAQQSVPADLTTISATRDGLRMHASALIYRGGPAEIRDRMNGHVVAGPVTPPLTTPLTVAGLLLGLVGGWLLAGWAGYRLRALPLLVRAGPLALALGAAALLGRLTYATYHQATMVLRAEPVEYFSSLPIHYPYLDDFTFGWSATAGLVTALVAVVLTLALRPRATPQDAPA
jgi:hypothetical protein